MNAAGVVNAIKKYGLVVGPDYEPGIGSKIIGWSVYETWLDASDDTQSMSWIANQRAIATAPWLSVAVHEAVKKIKAKRNKKHKEICAQKALTGESK